MKFKLLQESVQYYPGTFVDVTTFLDPSGNPYELKVSKLPGGNNPSEPPEQQPKIRINNKTGKREIYIPQMKIWRQL